MGDMEYTLRYESEGSDGKMYTRYPCTRYSDTRPGGPVGYTDRLSGYWGPITWKTYAGAQKNLRKYSPGGDLLSATVVGIETGYLETDRKTVEVEDLEASRKEYGERLRLIKEERQRDHERYDREQEAFRAALTNMRKHLDEHGITAELSTYNEEVKLTFDEMHRVLGMLH